MQIEFAAGTDQGLVRQRNEDAVLVMPKLGLTVLSDGMGGHQAGDVASRMAIEVICKFLGEHAKKKTNPGPSPLDAESLAAALRLANQRILGRARKDSACFGMGATAVVANFVEGHFSCAHLGDSRLYLYENRTLEQLTEDHTLAQEYVRQGVLTPEEAENWVGRNMLVRGLGIEEEVQPEITEGELAPGQLYLMSSDGLHDAVSHDIIERLLGDAQASLKHMIGKLILAANHNGGPDNISVVLIRVSK